KTDLLYAIANEQDDAGDPDRGFRYADSLDLLAKAARYEKGHARALDIRGWAHKNKGEFTAALPIFREQLSIFTHLRDLEGQGRAYSNLGATWQEMQAHDSAIVYLLKSLEVKEKLGNMSDVASGLANIANAYNDLDAHDKAIEMHLRALSIRRELGEEKRTMFTLNNLMVAYGTSGNTEKATAYADSALAIALKYNNKMVAGVVCGGMGHVLNEQRRYSESIAWCERSLAYLSEANRKANMVFPLANMAAAYIGLGQYGKGLEVNQRGWAIMQRLNLQEPLDPYHENFANAYAGLRDFEDAYKWHKVYSARLDTVNRNDYVSKIANVEAKYNLAKKEQEILEQRAQNFRQQVTIIALSIALLTLLLLGWLLYNRYRLRKKAELDAAIIREQRLGLNAVIEAQEGERKRIARDLHDGLAQELVALKLGFDALRRKWGKAVPEESSLLTDLSAQLDASCSEVRSIAHLMSPPMLEQQGLAPSLELLLLHTLQPIGVEAQFLAHGLPPRLEEKTEIGLYRIAQELLNNVAKHAQAARVQLELSQADRQVVMRLADDGRGFDFEAARSRGTMGLLNILSRVSTLGGEFSTERNQPRGTVTLVKVPV
ncbi:MAG TPA: sensor histidine kinase, partial [Saprospiraceae bacterium]|nr:sensor histidine kinase [Saprospiraceae bacterium]